MSRIGESMKTERLVVVRDRKRREQRMTAKSIGFLDWGGGRGDENVMKLYVVIFQNSMIILKIIELYSQTGELYDMLIIFQ